MTSSPSRLSGEGSHAYLAKYATKSIDGGGLLDRRLRSVHHLDELDLPEQLRRMATVAWELGARPALKDLNLRTWAHCLGYRGHWLTKSRYWSMTFTELRARRQRGDSNSSASTLTTSSGGSANGPTKGSGTSTLVMPGWPLQPPPAGSSTDALHGRSDDLR